MSVQIINIPIIGGIDSDTPDMSVPNGFQRDIVNFESIENGRGVQTVAGFKRYDGRNTSDLISIYKVHFDSANISPVKEDYLFKDDNQGIVTVDAVIESGDISNGTGVGYLFMIIAPDCEFNVGDVVDVNSNGNFTITNIEVYEKGEDTITTYVDIITNSRNIYEKAFIDRVPGSGKIIGTFILNDELFAIRDNADATKALIYKATPNSWIQVDDVELPATGSLQFVIYNFGDGDKLYGILGDTDIFIFDGYSITWTGPSVSPGLFPSLITEFNNQLVVYYPDTINSSGSLFLSAVGDPTNWEDTDAGVAEIKIPYRVTGIESLLGSKLGIFGKHIYILSVLDDGSYYFEKFAVNVDVSANTIGKITDLAYISKNNLYVLSTTNKFGDFEVNSLTKNTYKLLEVICSGGAKFSLSIPSKSQFRVYTGRNTLIFTFINPTYVLVTRQLYSFNLVTVSNINRKDHSSEFYYGTDSGYILKGDYGYTFSYEYINSRSQTPNIPIVNPQIKTRLRKIFIPAELGVSSTNICVDINTIDYFRPNCYQGSDFIKTSVDGAEFDVDYFDQSYFGFGNTNEDSNINLHLTGTTPSVIVSITNTNYGLLPSKFSNIYLQHSPRGRLK